MPIAYKAEINIGCFCDNCRPVHWSHWSQGFDPGRAFVGRSGMGQAGPIRQGSKGPGWIWRIPPQKDGMVR